MCLQPIKHMEFFQNKENALAEQKKKKKKTVQSNQIKASGLSFKNKIKTM